MRPTAKMTKQACADMTYPRFSFVPRLAYVIAEDGGGPIVIFSAVAYRGEWKSTLLACGTPPQRTTPQQTDHRGMEHRTDTGRPSELNPTQLLLRLE
jgi:hypothetical protein